MFYINNDKLENTLTVAASIACACLMAATGMELTGLGGGGGGGGAPAAGAAGFEGGGAAATKNKIN